MLKPQLDIPPLTQHEEARSELQLKLEAVQDNLRLCKQVQERKAARFPHQQSIHLRENFSVAPGSQEPMTEIVEHLARPIGMFCLGVYCHYTWMLVP